MASCVNTGNGKFQELKERYGVDEIDLELGIKTWMDEKGVEWEEERDAELEAWLDDYFMVSREKVVEGDGIGDMEEVYEGYNGREYEDADAVMDDAEKLKRVYGEEYVRVVGTEGGGYKVMMAKPVTREAEVKKRVGEAVRRWMKKMGMVVHEGVTAEGEKEVETRIKPQYINKSLSKEEKRAIQKYVRDVIKQTGSSFIVIDDVLYYIDHTDREGVINRGREDGFGCRGRVDVSTLTKEEINELTEYLQYGNFRTQEDANRWTKSIYKRHKSDALNSVGNENGRTYGGDAGLSSRSPEGAVGGRGIVGSDEKYPEKVWIKIPDADGTVAARYRLVESNNVLGWTENGEINLTDLGIDANTPIHEYTHLWDDAVRAKQPKLWNRGVELMKETSLWDEVANEEEYGQKWKDLSDEEREYKIATEVHARLTGENGERLLEEIAKDKGTDFITKLRQWLTDVFRYLAKTFTNWTDSEINSLTLDEFCALTMRDFSEGFDPTTVYKDMSGRKGRKYRRKEIPAELQKYVPKMQRAIMEVEEMMAKNRDEIARHPNFDKNHVYGIQVAAPVKDGFVSNGKYYRNADTSVTYSKYTLADVAGVKLDAPDAEDKANLARYTKPASEIGNMVDGFCRDFFLLDEDTLSEISDALIVYDDYDKVDKILKSAGKKGLLCHNMSQENRMSLLGDMINIVNQLDLAYGKNNWKLFTDEFPMAVRFTHDGKAQTMVGTLDALLAYYDVDSHSVKYRVMDFKTFRTDPYNPTDNYVESHRMKLAGYGVQTSAYKSMLETNNPEIFIDENGNSRITGTNVVAFNVAAPEYEGKKYPADYEFDDDEKIPRYSVAEDGTLLYDGEPIDLEIRWVPFSEQSGPVKEGFDEEHWLQDNYEASVDTQEILLADYRKTFTREYAQPYMDKIIYEVRHNGVEMTNEECQTVGNYIVQRASARIDDMRKDPALRDKILEGTPGQTNVENFKKKWGTAAEEQISLMSRDEFVDFVNINNVFQYIKDNEFGEEKSVSEKGEKKLQFIREHFDAFLEYGSAKLIEMEDMQLRLAKPRMVKQEGEDEVQSLASIERMEENQKEHWQTVQRQTSAIAGLSTRIRRVLGRLHDTSRSTEKYGYDLEMYTDSRKAAEKIFEWTTGCYTIEAMEREMRRRQKNYPWVKELLELIQEEPLRSEFFKNFRKDSLTYTIVDTYKDSNGNLKFRTFTINTKGAVYSAVEEAGDIITSGNSDIVDVVDEMIIPDETKIADLLKKCESVEKEWIDRKSKSMSDAEKKAFISKLANDMSDVYNNLGLVLLEPKVVEEYLSDKFEASETRENKGTLMQDARRILKFLKEKPNDFFDHSHKKTEQTGYPAYVRIMKTYQDYVEKQVESSGYDNGKTYYTYSTPSYAMRLFDELGNHEGFMSEEEYQAYLEDNFGKFEWFKKNGHWRNEVLKELSEKNSKERDNLDYKIQLSFNGIEYTKLSELGYALSLLTEFEYWDNESHLPGEQQKYAWYRMPIFSNKPSSEFVKLKRYSLDECRSEMPNMLIDTFLQELDRIKDVLNKACDPNGNPIANFDMSSRDKKKFAKALEHYKSSSITVNDLMELAFDSQDSHGAKLHFLSFMNGNEEVMDYMAAYINGENFDYGEFSTTVANAIRTFMDDKCETEFAHWEKMGLFDKHKVYNPKTKKDEDVYDWMDKFFGEKDLQRPEEEIKNMMKDRISEFIWNDFFAEVGIVQLTVTDIAYYKNAEDFQKRYAQLHSPAMRLNESATYTDESGEHRFSDGYERSMKLKDMVISMDDTKDAVEKAFDILIDKSKLLKDGVERDAMVAHYQILKKKISAMFDKVNVADAQGYCSPTSYRKRAAMQGEWDMNGKQEQAYQRIINGDFAVSDLDFMCQPLKGFVYGQMDKTNMSLNVRDASGQTAAPFSHRKVPIQEKNSEYMLFLADTVIRGAKAIKTDANIGFGDELIAMFDFMEASAYDGRAVYRDGKVWINNRMLKDSTLRGDDGLVYEADNDGNITVKGKKGLKDNLKDGHVINKGDYNGKGIDTIQFESAIKSGLCGPIDINPKGGKHRSYTEIMDILSDAAYSDASHLDDAEGERYRGDFVDTIRYSEYGIQQNVPAHFEDNEQRMGSQMRILSVTDINNDAVLQLPMFWGKMNGRALQNEYFELISKNIYEDYDELVHDLGLDTADKLTRNVIISDLLKQSIRRDSKYNIDLIYAVSLNADGDFNIPLTDPTMSQKIEALLNSIIKSRINKQNVAGGPVVQTSGYGLSHNLQIEKDANGTPKCFQCMIPIPSKELADILEIRDEEGNRTGRYYTFEEARKLHLISKKDEEWLSKAVAYRIPTEDKYSMLPMKIVGFTPRAAGEVVMMPQEITQLTGSDFDVDKMYIMLPSFERNRDYNPEKVVASEYEQYEDEEQNTDKRKKKDYTSRFHYSKDLNTRDGRNNKILMMQYAVLSNEDTAEKIWNGGNFENLRDVAKEILDCEGNTMESGRNILFADTQVYFHKQNMVAAQLIGVFANNNTSHGFVSIYPTTMRMTSRAMEEGFMTDVDFTFSIKEGDQVITVGPNQNNTIDKLRGYDKNYISKNIASYLAASVDAAKDPVLNFMNINTTTVDAAMVLIRLGFSPRTVGFLMAQPIIREVVEIYDRRSNTGHYVDIQDVIAEVYKSHFNKEWSENKAALSEHINESFYFDVEQLKKRIANESEEKDGFEELDENLLMLFSGLKELGQDMGDLTYATKFNSVTNAPGPRVADNIGSYFRVERLYVSNSDGQTRFTTHDDNGHVVKITDVCPLIKAFYDTTVNLGEDTESVSKMLFGNYFIQYTQDFSDILDYFIANNIKLTNDEIDELAKDFVLFSITNIEGWYKGKGADGRRKSLSKLMTELPRKLTVMKKKKAYKDNALLDALRVNKKNKRMPFRVIETKDSQHGRDGEEAISSAWVTMLHGTDEERKFAEDLFIYSVMRGGFGYLPRNFSHLAPPELRQELLDGRYIERLQSPEAMTSNGNMRMSLTEKDRFVSQFILNHAFNEKLITEYDDIPADGTTNEAVIAVTNKERGYDRQLMVKDEAGHYTVAEELGVRYNLKEYDRNTVPADMKSIISKKDREKNARYKKRERRDATIKSAKTQSSVFYESLFTEEETKRIENEIKNDPKKACTN